MTESRNDTQDMTKTSGLPRWVRRACLIGIATIAFIIVAVGVFIGVLGSDQERVDRVYAQGIGRAVELCNEALVGVFGPGGIGSNPIELGLKVYSSETQSWVGFDEFRTEALDGRVVVLVHGLDEPGGIWDQLAPALANEGHQVVRFDYPNDQSIALSATEFGQSLDQLSARGADRMDLVCHSMGGLVARDTITRNGFETHGIRVERMVTIGTPNQGSPWARLRAVAEIREQVQRWVESDDLDPKRLLGFAQDGVGQAGTDLLPGSAYLNELNARDFPESIKMTCIVGQMVETNGSDLGAMVTQGAMRDLLGSRDAKVIADELGKLSNELGDGVVPMSSAALEGVEDVVVLKANHRGLIRNVELGAAIRQMNGLPQEAPPPGIEIVLDRLRR